MKTKEDIIIYVMKTLEGPGDNDPRDKGALTIWGVTSVSWQDYLGSKATWPPEDTSYEAMREVYYFLWDKMHINDLPVALKLVVFAFGVNAGWPTGVQLVQGALGLKQDAIIGPMTLAGYAVLMSTKDLSNTREFLGLKIIKHYFACSNSDWARKGWMNRLLKTIVYS